MANLVVAVEIAAKDLASGPLNAVTGSLGKLEHAATTPVRALGGLGGALGNVASIAGGFVLGGAITQLPGLLMGAAKAAAEEEKGVARLQQAVKNAGGDWDAQGKAIEGAIAQREKLGFADDALRSSLAMLTGQTGDVDEAMRRQALAMDLSRGAGIDLGTASKLLGKVTDENVNVLGRYGISVEKGASQTELFAAIQQKFGGQAAAAANTAAGQWEIFQNQLGNLSEDIGGALLPVMTKLGGEAIKLIDALRESEAVQAIFAMFGDSLQRSADMGEALLDALAPLGDLAGGPLTGLADAWRTVQQVFAGDWEASDQIDPLINLIGMLATIVRDDVMPVLQAFGEVVKAVFAGDFAAAGEILGNTLDFIGTQLVTDLAAWGQAFLAWVPPMIPPLLAQLGQLALQLGQWLLTTAGEILKQLAQWELAFIQWIAPMIPPFLQELGRLLVEFVNWFVASLPALVEQLQVWAKSFIDWIAPIIPPLLLELGKLLLDMGVWMATVALPAIVEQLAAWGLAFGEWVITNALPALLGKLGELLTNLGTWFVNTGGPWFVARGGELATSMITGLATLLAGLGAKIGEVLSAIEINVGPFHLSGKTGFRIDAPTMPQISLPGFGGGTSGGGATVGGDVESWLTEAIRITGAQPNELAGLKRLVQAESGGSPTAKNPVPVIVAGVNYGHATGLLQTLPGTFSANALPGMTDIMNPIHNAVAAIRYIMQEYGSVYNTPLFKGGEYKGYSLISGFQGPEMDPSGVTSFGTAVDQVVASLAKWTAQQAGINTTLSASGQAIDATTGALAPYAEGTDAATGALMSHEQQLRLAQSAMPPLLENIGQTTSGLMGEQQALALATDAMPPLIDATGEAADVTGAAADAFDDVNGNLEDLSDGLGDNADAWGDWADNVSDAVKQALKAAARGDFKGVQKAFNIDLENLGGGLEYQHGGYIGEPVAGIGMRSGTSYTFGEAGGEFVLPAGGGGGSMLAELRALVAAIERRPVVVEVDGERLMNVTRRHGAYNADRNGGHWGLG